MEYKTTKIHVSEKQSYVSSLSPLDWEIDKEEINGEYLNITWKRNDETPYYAQLKEYEKKLSPSLISIWFVIIPMILAVLFTTAFLIAYLINKDNFDKEKWFLIFLLPGVISIVFMSGFYLYRMFQMNKYLTSYSEKEKEIYKKVKELKDQYK